MADEMTFYFGKRINYVDSEAVVTLRFLTLLVLQMY
jgi:hypothetical protein